MTYPRPVEAEDLPLEIPLTRLGKDSPALVLSGSVGPAQSASDEVGTEELITCPECGEMAHADTARRRAEDFCRTCDYPLFWARSAVILPNGQETGASLRRLPGTVGRAATAALNCPHCDEPNSPIAQICIRCGGDLHPVAPPDPEPEPVAVYIAPPPEPEPEVRDYFWWILAAALILLVVIAGVVWLLQR